MPRKQNGFGNTKSFSVKAAESINSKIHKGKSLGAAGFYPSDRKFGASVNRSVIEKYNLDSDWVKWRKGYEYYNRAAWYRLEEYDPITETYTDSKIKSVLYQGTPYQVDVEFDGYKFATKDSDSNNHYVIKRTTTSKPDLGVITKVENDPLLYPDQKKYKEIWCQGTAGADTRLLAQMIGERITDGVTEASLNYVLTNKKRPALFIGKSYEEMAQVTLTIQKSDITSESDLNSYQDLINKVVYIPDFYQEKDISLVDSINWIDADFYFAAQVEDEVPPQPIEILDPEQELLPPTLYDIKDLPKVMTASASYSIKGTYLYKKDLYQRFYGKQYVTADVIASEVTDVSYVVLPFKILGVTETPTTLEIVSVPFSGEFKLYAPTNVDADTLGGGYLVFTDYSFTKTMLDEYDGEYYHDLSDPGVLPWQRIETDIDPWMDEVFTSGQTLQPATMYTCSCPNYSRSLLRAPQETQDAGTRKINRQRRYPLPSVLSQGDFEALGANTASGTAATWETRQDKMSFKMCKHTIAAMFIERIKVQEPSEYPTIEARVQFEEKLRKEIEERGYRFKQSYRRGGITALEVVFALAQGLNLDDIETAYVMLNSTF